MAEQNGSPREGFFRQYLGVFRYTRRAVSLVWTTHRGITFALGALTLFGGLLPAGIAYVGKLIVDAVVHAAQSGTAADRMDALMWVGVEATLVIGLAGCQRGLNVCQSLLRALLGQRVNVLVLEKALELDLPQFEDSEIYDKLTRARREASNRPLSLVTRTFGLVQNGISLVSYAGLLLQFSPLAVFILAAAGIPAFLVETKFSGAAFRLFRWRTPETRHQVYLEWVMAREDYAKETMLFRLGRRMLRRYQQIFDKLFTEDRKLTIRRGFWGYVLGLLSTAAFYGAYIWIAIETINKNLTLGDMTMYLLVFKQGQSAFSAVLDAISGMYEDNLYLSNLYEFLEEPVHYRVGTVRSGQRPGDGVRFENVTFTYPGAERAAVREVSLHLKPGQKVALVGENGSGKTTIIKLLTGLYRPQDGRITLDGVNLNDWDTETLRKRIGVVLQDFVHYQFTVGENIGVGDVDHMYDEPRWVEASRKGLAEPFIRKLPSEFHTQLGRWFENGQELSIGQWQKIALSRAFMAENADILVLDEPTSAMDAEAEASIFQHLRDVTGDQMTILISHRFSTVRVADHIIVMEEGSIAEEGTHDELIRSDGRYARLFTLQAKGYQ